jgi:hypothetical protein
MITNVRTEGFKGFDINEAVPSKAIYTGKNKSGKSSRAGAIAIALFGYIPFSTSGKLPGDILASYGSDSLVCAVTINGTEFARKFAKNSKGGASRGFQIDGKRTSAENFAILLNQAGAPKIADVAQFMKESEAKKIDTLFDLFPNETLANIDSEIEEAKEDVSRLKKKKEGAESTVIRLTNSKQSIEIPAGSISEVKAEIKTIEAQIVDLEKQIKQAEIEEAKVKAEAEGERKEKERAEKEAEEKKVDQIDAIITKGEQQIADFKENNNIPQDQDIVGGHNIPDANGSFVFPSNQNEISNQIYAKESILRIIAALKGSGCGTCAALIIAKQELKKFKGVS